MRVLVLGGSGFIGRFACEALVQRGHAVSVLARPVLGTAGVDRAQNIRVERLAEAMRGHAAALDLLGHVGLQAEDPTHLELARRRTAAITRAASLAELQRLGFLSSMSVYGGHPCPHESTALQPRSAYARGKCLAETLYAEWAGAEPSRSLLLVRSSVVFGEGGRGNVERLMQQLLRRRFLQVGQGENRKAIAYAGNLAAFLAFGLERLQGARCLNYADQPVMRVHELLDELRALDPRVPRWLPRVPQAPALAAAGLIDAARRWLGQPDSALRARVAAFCAETGADTSALQATGFVAPIPLREALRRTLTALRA